MFTLDSHIQIGAIRFDQVVDVKITRSVDLLSDTATIELPTRFVLKDSNEQQSTERVFKAGDPVSITLGYLDHFSKEEFVGFVTSVEPGTPVKVHCEDAVWKIRQKSCNKNFKAVDISEVLNYILEGTGVSLSGKTPKVQFKKFLLKNVNGAQALQKIKDEFGLSLYLDNEGKLYAGLRQTEGDGTVVTYDLEGNIQKQSLQYKTADEVKIKLTAKGWKQDNTHVQVEVGDPEGENRTWQTYGVDNAETLKTLAKSRLDELKYEGYRGSLTSWLIPFADRGMTSAVIDARYPEREGNYFIPKVVVTFGKRGAKRTVTLGRKI